MNKPKRRVPVVLMVTVLALVLFMIYCGAQIVQTMLVRPGQEPQQPGKTIIRGDTAYFPRQDITVILIMGIDEEGPVKNSGSYRNTGESDMVALLILDETEKSYSLLCLNRDTMLNMPVLGVGGKQAGTCFGQLALSHTYGTGLADSAENTRKTVSDFLYGLRIDYYIAVNMDAIGIINDAVGGVTVTVTEDFSAVDPSITMGEMTLNREQALTFVRTRKDVGTQLNISRMERHKAYLSGLSEAFDRKLASSDSFVLELYEQIQAYAVTDCSVHMISAYLQRCSEYTLKELVSPEGDNVLGEEYYEFYADEEKLDDLILRLFYAPK